MKILHIVGARPNFMKAAATIAALRESFAPEQVLVHTGQHFDAKMSDIFFHQLNLPEPDFNLGVGGGTRCSQISRILRELEPIRQKLSPDVMLVYGDVNSTLAAAIVGSCTNTFLGHVEAGLRSRDRAMPEEINRICVDHCSDLLFIHSAEAGHNLEKEGISASKIYFVGNVMIDTLKRFLPQVKLPPDLALPDNYALVTLHRPSNVDHEATLYGLIQSLAQISKNIPIVFPVHPRTRKNLASKEFHGMESKRFLFLEPLGYLEFLALQKHARLIVTDSGGIRKNPRILGFLA